jgi:hypothetical protein
MGMKRGRDRRGALEIEGKEGLVDTKSSEGMVSRGTVDAQDRRTVAGEDAAEQCWKGEWVGGW